MHGPGPIARYVAKRHAITHEALRKEVAIDPATSSQVADDLTEIYLERSFADYAARFGVARAIAKACAMIDEAQCARGGQ